MSDEFTVANIFPADPPPTPDKLLLPAMYSRPRSRMSLLKSFAILNENSFACIGAVASKLSAKVASTLGLKNCTLVATAGNETGRVKSTLPVTVLTAATKVLSGINKSVSIAP